MQMVINPTRKPVLKAVVITIILCAVVFTRRIPYTLRDLDPESLGNFNKRHNETLRDTYQNGFIYSNEHLCVAQNKIPVFIAITSDPTHWLRRKAIRKLFKEFHQQNFSMGFFVGRIDDATTRKLVESEQNQYRDVIQGNYLDTYYNLTYKTLSILEWVQNFCTDTTFVLKTDDDVYINVTNLSNFIAKTDEKSNSIYGRLLKKLQPYRDPSIKYAVTLDQYKLDRYPDFVSGPAYLVPIHLIGQIYQKALDYYYLNVEDVFITGIVAGVLDIRLVHIPEFCNMGIVANGVGMSDAITIHGLDVENHPIAMYMKRESEL